MGNNRDGLKTVFQLFWFCELRKSTGGLAANAKQNMIRAPHGELNRLGLGFLTA